MRTAILLVKKRDADRPDLTYYDHVGQAKLDFKDLVRQAEHSVSTEIEYAQLWTSSRGRVKRKRFRKVSALTNPKTETAKARKAADAKAKKAADAKKPESNPAS